MTGGLWNFSSRGFLANQERGVGHVQRGENGGEQGGSVWRLGVYEHRPHALESRPQPPSSVAAAFIHR